MHAYSETSVTEFCGVYSNGSLYTDSSAMMLDEILLLLVTKLWLYICKKNQKEIN